MGGLGDTRPACRRLRRRRTLDGAVACRSHFTLIWSDLVAVHFIYLLFLFVETNCTTKSMNGTENRGRDTHSEKPEHKPATAPLFCFS